MPMRGPTTTPAIQSLLCEFFFGWLLFTVGGGVVLCVTVGVVDAVIEDPVGDEMAEEVAENMLPILRLVWASLSWFREPYLMWRPIPDR